MSVVTQIAGIVFSISCEKPTDGVDLRGSCKQFVGAVEPDITLHAHSDGLPQISVQDEDKVFESGSSWSLYRANGQNVFVLKSPKLGPIPYRIAAFDRDFRQGEVYSRVLEPQGGRDGLLSKVLGCPLAEVLLICLLARGRGLMVHACGVDDGGRGYVFAGKSTYGKTTMAKLWKDKALILNDDRIVLRLREGRFWMYGTPWYGEYASLSPEGVPVEKVFFLRHAETNSVRRKEGLAALSALLTRCFPPLWDQKGMRFTLDFGAHLVRAVPCYELGFAPDESVLEFVRSVN